MPDSLEPKAQTPTPSSVREWLERAAGWRFASLLFQSPSPQSVDELNELLHEIPLSWRPPDEGFVETDLDARERDFHRLLGPGGLPACESSYDDAAMAGRGPLLAEIAGFYQAFRYEPSVDVREVPDAAAVELGFLSYLALKVAYALDAGLTDELAVTVTAYRDFLERHVGFWLPRYLERVAAEDSPFYAGAADWLRSAWPRLAEPAPDSRH